MAEDHTYGFDTLLKCRPLEKKDRWYPHRVNTYLEALTLSEEQAYGDALERNIAYNLQYLEFLEKEFRELEISAVISRMLVKTYVVTGMAVIEGIFSNIVLSRNLCRRRDTQGPESLDTLISRLEASPEVLDISPEVYQNLAALRKERNRIHLGNLKDEHDHDYNAFDSEDYKTMREALYQVLTSQTVTRKPELFDFLKKKKE